jgi:hypothetical protein
MITFLASGLWHGASWTYVIWGALHGIVQVMEDHIKIKPGSKFTRILSWIVVFAFCNFAWVFFRAETIGDALFVIRTLVKDIAQPTTFLHSNRGPTKTDFYYILASIAILCGVDFAQTKTDVILWISKRPVILRWLLYFFLLWLILFFWNPAGTSEFVYFQF